jgi:hypothetical protein
MKNKWKCILKEGMIHTGGRNYLFQPCTGCVVVLKFGLLGVDG